jgi:hypothetical protein
MGGARLANVVCVLLRGGQLESLVGGRVITPPSLGIDESSPNVASRPEVTPPLEPLPPELPEPPLPELLLLFGENGFGLEVGEELEEQLARG